MNKILQRNKETLLILLKQYNIDRTINELIDLESVFIFVEYYKNEDSSQSSELYRAILYANIRYEVKNNNVVKLTKAKKISLFTLGKKMIKKLSEEEVEKIILELTLISKLIKQIKLINKINYEENDIQDIFQSLEYANL